MFVDPFELKTTLLDILKFSNDNPEAVQDIYNRDPKNYISNMVQECAPTTPVNIIEKEDVIIIYTYVEICGSAIDQKIADTNITYEEATLDGISKPWSGEYMGKTVISLPVPTNNGPCVRVNVINSLGVSNVSYWENL